MTYTITLQLYELLWGIAESQHAASIYKRTGNKVGTRSAAASWQQRWCGSPVPSSRQESWAYYG